MPVHSREKKENSHEDMEVDFPEQDGSSTDDEDTVSSSVSEDGDSSGRRSRPYTLQFITHACLSRVGLTKCVVSLKKNQLCIVWTRDVCLDYRCDDRPVLSFSEQRWMMRTARGGGWSVWMR